MYTEQRSEDGSLGGIIRNSDGANIPLADGNSDYAAYLQWVADGGVVSPDPDWTLVNVQKRAKLTIGQLCATEITSTGGWTIARYTRAIGGEYSDPNAGQLAADYSREINAQCDSYKVSVDAAVDMPTVDAIVAGVTWDTTGLTGYGGLA